MTDTAITKGATPSDDDWIKPAATGAGSLPAFVKTLWGRRFVVAAIVLICVGAALGAALSATKEYTAHAQLLVTPVPAGDGTPIGLGLLRDSGSPDRDMVTATQMVTDRGVADYVRRRLDLEDTVEQLLGRVEAEPVAQSNVIDIAARAGTPRGAAALADAFAAATISRRRQALRAQIDAATAGLAEQLRSLDSAGDEGGTVREELRRQQAALHALRSQPTPEFHRQGGPASVPTGASSPRVLRSAVAAGLIGMILGGIAVFTLNALDPRLRGEHQLRALFRLPLLARIPQVRTKRRHAGPLRAADLSPEATEAYGRLRSTIEDMPGRWRGPRSILVAGATGGEGRTTTAINLAYAFASSGRSTILMEGDLRHPSIAEALPVSGAPTSDNVVAGGLPMEDALLTVDGTDGRLRVLATAADGSWVPEGFSRRGADLLTEAQSMADVVVVDAPPPAEDARLLFLAHHVDDILLVARIDRTDLSRLRDLADTLKENRLRPAGTILVGVSGPGGSAPS
jgi:Mrp family chromosome partitioning ATPase/capsular polysaccharide biosynthesis protein